jgi:hypothetical protein
MIKGTILFVLINVGSKSEGQHPFLYEGNGVFRKVWLDGDISFAGDKLREYDGKYVSLSGEADENDVFIIKSIEEIKKQDI